MSTTPPGRCSTAWSTAGPRGSCGAPTPRDVAAAIRAARADDRLISVYGGGHGVTGSAVVDGGVCVDLRAIDHVVVDPEARTARVGGGATWGAVDAATQEHGLAVTGGRVSTTGVGGLVTRQRQRLARTHLRVHLRQPGLGRGGDGGVGGRDRLGGVEPRAVLGASGRRRQLRRRHRVHVQAAPGRARSSTAGCCSTPGSWPATCCATGATSCRRAPRGRQRCRADHRSAGGVRPRGGARDARGRRDRALRR